MNSFLLHAPCSPNRVVRISSALPRTQMQKPREWSTRNWDATRDRLGGTYQCAAARAGCWEEAARTVSFLPSMQARVSLRAFIRNTCTCIYYCTCNRSIAVLGSEMAIPVVDVSTACSEEVESGVVQQIHTAFSTVGFVFITGHGIPRQLVRAATLDSRL